MVTFQTFPEYSFTRTIITNNVTRKAGYGAEIQVLDSIDGHRRLPTVLTQLNIINIIRSLSVYAYHKVCNICYWDLLPGLQHATSGPALNHLNAVHALIFYFHSYDPIHTKITLAESFHFDVVHPLCLEFSVLK
jgi:hypothetical protein